MFDICSIALVNSFFLRNFLESFPSLDGLASILLDEVKVIIIQFLWGLLLFPVALSIFSALAACLAILTFPFFEFAIWNNEATKL